MSEVRTFAVERPKLLIITICISTISANQLIRKAANDGEEEEDEGDVDEEAVAQRSTGAKRIIMKKRVVLLSTGAPIGAVDYRHNFP